MWAFSPRGWAGSRSPFPRKCRLPWWERGLAVGSSATTEPPLRGCTGFSAFPCGQGQVWECFVPLKEQGELSQGLMGMGVESLLRVRAGTTTEPWGIRWCDAKRAESVQFCVLVGLPWLGVGCLGRHREIRLPAPVARLPSVPARWPQNQDGFGLSKASWAAKGPTAWSLPWPGATEGFRRGFPCAWQPEGVQQPRAEPSLGSSSGNPSRDAEAAGEFPPRGRGWGEFNSSAEAECVQDAWLLEGGRMGLRALHLW